MMDVSSTAKNGPIYRKPQSTSATR